MNVLVLGMLALFALIVLCGVLFGMVRGRKKAFIRLITIVAAFVLALIFTPVILNIVGSNVKETLLDYIVKNVDDIGGTIVGPLGTYYEDIVKILGMIINPLLFFAVFTAFNILAYIVYFILGLTIGKRGTDKDGNPKKKGRLFGLLFGAACGFVAFFALFVPLNGYIPIIAKAEDIEINGESPLAFVTDINDALPGDMELDFKAYADAPAIKALGIGLGNPCFDMLSSVKVRGYRLKAKDEISVALEAFSKFGELGEESAGGDTTETDFSPSSVSAAAESAEDGGDIFGDLHTLKDTVELALKSNTILVIFDMALDYAIDEPAFITDIIEGNDASQAAFRPAAEEGEVIPDPAPPEGEEEEGFDIMSILSDPDFAPVILGDIRKDIKGEILGSLDVLVAVQDVLGINFTEFDQDAIMDIGADDSPAIVNGEEVMNDEGQPMGKVEYFINKLLSVKTVKNIFSFATPLIMEPLADQIGIEVSAERPEMDDAAWEKEEKALMQIFGGFKAITDLLDLDADTSAGSDSQITKLTDFFTVKNSEGNYTATKSLGGLMSGLRDSMLLGALYDGVTEFDETAGEYWFISRLNTMLYEAVDSGEPEALIPMSSVSTAADGDDPPNVGDIAAKSLRFIFIQENARKEGSHANDTIDFQKLDWEKVFDGLVVRINGVAQLQSLTDGGLTADSAGAIADFVRTMGDSPEAIDALEEMIYSLIPESNTNFTVPDLRQEGIDFDKEADIIEEMAKYTDPEAMVDLDQDEVDGLMENIVESSIVIPMLESQSTNFTDSIDDDTTNMINDWIARNEGEYSEEQINRIRNLMLRDQVAA